MGSTMFSLTAFPPGHHGDRRRAAQRETFTSILEVCE